MVWISLTATKFFLTKHLFVHNDKEWRLGLILSITIKDHEPATHQRGNIV